MKSAAIVGRAATAAWAPFDQEAWEIFGLAWVRYPRASLLFDIHHPDFKKDETKDYNSHHNPDRKYFANVNATGLPVLCHPEAIGKGKFELGQPFPYEEIGKVVPFPYLDCTISYMIAYAMLEGYQRIALWGCHFKGNDREQIQLPSVTYLIGLAQGRGIEVSIGPGSPMMSSAYVMGRYGITQEKRWSPSQG